MASYLLTWNPKNINYQTSDVQIAKLSERTLKHGNVRWRWSIGNRKQIQKGDRVFLIRQTVEPKGIVGAGWVVKAIDDDGWKGVLFEFQLLLDPHIYSPLDTRQFSGRLAEVHWGTQTSGIRIDPDKELESQWKSHIKKVLSSQDDVEETSYWEGKIAFRLHRIRERNRNLVESAKAAFKRKHGRLFCEVCEFDFEQTYGKVGENFIEAHHLLALNKRTKNSRTTLSDLAMVCSNCHRMFHRKASGTTISQMKKLIAHQK